MSDRSHKSLEGIGGGRDQRWKNTTRKEDPIEDKRRSLHTCTSQQRRVNPR
jgi:hypothetical protein